MSCVKRVTPLPTDDRVFSFFKHDCVCKDMPVDFDNYNAWVLGGKRYYEMMRLLEKCANMGFDDLKDTK